MNLRGPIKHLEFVNQLKNYSLLTKDCVRLNHITNFPSHLTVSTAYEVVSESSRTVTVVTASVTE
jgi:hypothetical protein